MRPRLLDLFCGDGGAGMGYHRAGFDVVGVDLADHAEHYPFEFHQGDALEFPLDGFDAVHASPPCQGYSTMGNRYRDKGGPEWPKLIAPMRERLQAGGVPWVIENVVGARPEMRNPVLLNGAMFGLGVDRPRLFETSFFVMAPCPAPQGRIVGVYGRHHDGRRLWSRTDGTELRAPRTVEEARAAMGVDWPMPWDGLRECIPPAYTQHLGEQLIAALEPAA